MVKLVFGLFEGVLGNWCLILSGRKEFHVCACINEWDVVRIPVEIPCPRGPK